MIQILISFLIHWLLFCCVTNLARLVLLQTKYPVTFSVKDLIVLTAVTAIISAIFHMVGFIFFEKYATMVFNYLHYIPS